MQNQEDKITNDQADGDSTANTTDNTAENATVTDETTVSTDYEAKIAEANEKYLRLYSEFDNYRKRTIKEKSEIIKTAAEELFKAILPVIDDFDRAMKANEDVDDSKVIKEGIQLIYNKFKNATQQKGLTSFETKGEAFDPDIMEAITNVPAADDSQKGKVIDEVEKGYKLGDKVIRFAKVIIAQ